MYGYKYVWILPSTLPRHWWRNVTSVDCTVSQMEEFLTGHFRVTMPILFTDRQITPINGKVSDKAKLAQCAQSSYCSTTPSNQCNTLRGYCLLDRVSLLREHFNQMLYNMLVPSAVQLGIHTNLRWLITHTFIIIKCP